MSEWLREPALWRKVQRWLDCGDDTAQLVASRIIRNHPSYWSMEDAVLRELARKWSTDNPGA